jgi:hypothetical protein
VCVLRLLLQVVVYRPSISRFLQKYPPRLMHILPTKHSKPHYVCVLLLLLLLPAGGP